jgi:hypothetical protein
MVICSFVLAPLPLVLDGVLRYFANSSTGALHSWFRIADVGLSSETLLLHSVALLYASMGFAAFAPHVLNGLAAREYAPAGVQVCGLAFHTEQ